MTQTAHAEGGGWWATASPITCCPLKTEVSRAEGGEKGVMVISRPLPRSKGVWIPAVCFHVSISACTCLFSRICVYEWAKTCCEQAWSLISLRSLVLVMLLMRRGHCDTWRVRAARRAVWVCLQNKMYSRSNVSFSLSYFILFILDI